MRLTYALLATSLTIFGSAIAVTRQEPLAEQQFKNIQSFKGQKAGVVIPAMEFMCASLDVKCDYCHTEDRASDEKRAKQTAREMIAMQRDINERHFRGRNQVTCATCHGGHPNPIGVPRVTGIEVRPRRSQTVSPEAVLAAYERASGESPGAAAVGLRLDGTSISHGESARVEAIYSGSKFALVKHEAKSDQKQGFNGSLAWFTTPNGIQAVPLVYAIQYVNQCAIFSGPSTLPKLADPFGGTAKIGDRDMLVVGGAVAGDTTRLTLYFDKQTGLLSRTVFSYPTVLGNMPQINDYSDYRKVGGAERPMTIVNHTAEGDTTIHYRSVRVDPKISASTFDPPK